MATATQETLTTPSTLQSGLPETGTEAKRYSSLDAYRGFIMLILASEGFGFSALHGDPTWGGIARWFDHIPWEGGVFWDMIQPAFMFMVGLAMPFALARRKELGATENEEAEFLWENAFCKHCSLWTEPRVRCGCAVVGAHSPGHRKVVSSRPPSPFGTVAAARRRRFWAEREESSFHSQRRCW